jgi:hypothetical protein
MVILTFLISTLDFDELSASRLRRFTTGERTLLLVRKLGGPQSRRGHGNLEKFLFACYYRKLWRRISCFMHHTARKYFPTSVENTVNFTCTFRSAVILTLQCILLSLYPYAQSLRRIQYFYTSQMIQVAVHILLNNVIIM